MLLDDDEDLAASEIPASQRLETAVSHLGDIWILGDHPYGTWRRPRRHSL
jgi:hypothetical protein